MNVPIWAPTWRNHFQRGRSENIARMYGLDQATDLSAMSGGTLTFVGLGQHQAQLHFSGEPDCSVSIEGDYSVACSRDSPRDLQRHGCRVPPRSQLT